MATVRHALLAPRRGRTPFRSAERVGAALAFAPFLEAPFAGFVVDEADVLPALPGEAFPAQRTPVWSTRVQRVASGRELRASYYSAPLWEFSLRYEFLRERSLLREKSQLEAFFNARAGRGLSFWFRDRSEPAVARNQFASGDGMTRLFRVTRPVGGGREPIAAFDGAPSVWVGGSAASFPAEFQHLDGGYLLFANAPASGADLEWSGAFMFRCRFVDDSLQFQKDYSDIWSLRQLRFTSVK